jgi:hypothetical protein
MRKGNIEMPFVALPALAFPEAQEKLLRSIRKLQIKSILKRKICAVSAVTKVKAYHKILPKRANIFEWPRTGAIQMRSTITETVFAMVKVSIAIILMPPIIFDYQRPKRIRVDKMVMANAFTMVTVWREIMKRRPNISGYQQGKKIRKRNIIMGFALRTGTV